VGRTTTYRLKAETTLRSAAGETLLWLQLSGSWQIAGSQRGEIRARLVDPKLLVAGGKGATSGASSPDLSQALGEPVYWTLDRAGRVTDLRIVPGLSSTARDLWRLVVSATEIVRPDPVAVTWTTEEEDVMGRFRAAYAADGNRVTKQKLEYLQPRSGTLAAGAAPAYTVKESNGLFMLIDTGTIDRLEAVDHVVAQPQPPLPAMGARSVVRLERTGDADLMMSDDQWRRERATSVPASEARPGGPGPDFDRLRSANARLPELLAKRASASPAERAELFTALVSLLRIDREALQDARRRVTGGDPDTEWILDALGTAGTSDAQEVLIQVVGAPIHPVAVRFRALRGLSLVKAPVSQTLSTLRRYLDDPALGLQARLGLGSLAHEISKTDAEAAQRVAAPLVVGLAAAPSHSVRLEYLKALGNAGLPSTLPAIEPWLRDSSEAVRAEATRALRLVSGSRSDELLAAGLVSDPSPRVRDAALVAMGDRPVTDPLAAAVDGAIRRDRDVGVRQKAIKVGRFWMKGYPSIRQAIEGAAHRDPDSRVREVATSAL
jgi:HEAT repeat protein